MILIRLMLVAFALCAPSAAMAQEWSDFMSTEDRFSITFPGQPSVQEIKWPSEYGAVFPGRVYSAKQGMGSYSVTVIDYRNSEKLHAAIPKAESFTDPRYWQIDIQASIQYAATKFRQRPGAKVTYDAWHYIDLVEGHMLQLTNQDSSRSFISIYLHENRLYIVEATVPQGYPQPGLFQQNLSFLDEKGARVRYNEIYSNRLPPLPARGGGAGRGGAGGAGGAGRGNENRSGY
jgi:hypothetical protein